MVCRASDNTLNPKPIPPPFNIGLGGPMVAFPNLPFPDISIPEGIPEDIIDLLQSIFAIIPGAKLVPNADDAFRTVFSAVASLLNQLAPFLALYNMFQALLNLIICILNIICAIANPFAMADAIIKLFQNCLPAFLAIFPWIALIVMILALILLLINLIIFLITYIAAIIADLIANIKILAEAIQFDDDTSVLAAVQKIASLLCLIEQAFALLIAFQAVFAVVEALAKLAGQLPCGNSDPCCVDEYCPPFIKNNPNGITSTSGRLVYHNARTQSLVDLPSTLVLPNLRTESWQFVDDNTNESYPFKDVITPINGSIYWPQPLTFPNDSNLKVTPYTVSLRLFLDPTVFGHPAVNGAFSGPRYFRITNTIVSVQPYVGVLTYNNTIDTTPAYGNAMGTFKLVGGLVFEDDGLTEVNVGSSQGTLETFIHQPSTIDIPGFEDGYQISTVQYDWNINHKALMKYQLITAGCLPEVAIEQAVLASSIPTFDPAIVQIGGSLPDITGAMNCLNTSLLNFRADVSIENAAVFQAEVNTCLGNLQTQSESIFDTALQAGVSIYTSEVTLDPEIQFVDGYISVSVLLRDAGGSILSTNIPASVQDSIASKLSGTVTLGELSDFEYDGSLYFVSHITSDLPGTGSLQVSFNNGIFSEIVRDSVPTVINLRSYPYRFIGDGANASAQERRDLSDAALGGS